MRRLSLLLALSVLLPTGCSLPGWMLRPPAPPPTAAAVPARPAPQALQAYLGRWYVIAYVPSNVGRGHMNARQDVRWVNGALRIDYSFRTGPRAAARAVEVECTLVAEAPPSWDVHALRMVTVRQRLLEMAEDGQWALLDSPGSELAWIMARRPAMDTVQYTALRERLKGHGVNIDKVWRVAHTAAQVHQRGFDQPSDL